MSVGLPGIYVEIRGDYSQLQKEIKAAREMVKSQATGMSNALNNALSPNQINNNINRMVSSLGTLDRASTVVGKTFKNIGVDLGDLSKNTGITDKQFGVLQSKLLKTQAANAQQKALRQIATAAGLTEKEVRSLGRQFGLTPAQIKKVNTQLNYMERRFNPVNKGLGLMTSKVIALGSVWLGAQGLGALKQVTDQYTLIDSKLNLVTEDSDEFGKVYQRLFEISQETGTSFSTNAAAFANLQLQLKDTVPAEETLRIFNDINKSLVVNGSTTQEAESFTLQLKQALGSGVLAGEEFRAVTEANSYWATQLAKALDTDVAGLRKMSKDQKLTRDVVLDASKKMSEQINKDFSGIQKTIGRAQTELANAWKDIIADTNKSAEGTTTVAESISELAAVVHDNKEEIVGLFVGVLQVSGDVVEAIGNIVSSMRGFTAVGEGSLGFLEFAGMNAKELSEWLAKNPKELRETNIELDNVRKKIKEAQSTFGLWKDKKELISNLREEEARLVNQIHLIEERNSAVSNVEINKKTDDTEKELQEDITKTAEKESSKRIKIATDERLQLLKQSKDITKKRRELLEEETKDAVAAGKEIVDFWQVQHDEKYEVLSRSYDAQDQAEEEANAKHKAFTDEFVSFSNAATSDVVSAFVQGEDTKVAVAGIASSYLEKYAIDAATKGLEPIFEAIGGQIGAWVGLGTAQTSTEGDSWQQKLATGAGYLAAATAAVLGATAVGKSAFAEGGWIHRNGSGMIMDGSWKDDDVFLGYTGSGHNITANMAKGGEFVMDPETTAANIDILEDMRMSKKRYKFYAEGGPVSDPYTVAEGVNAVGFETFVSSWLKSGKWDGWKEGIKNAAIYYAGVAGTSVTGKEFGPDVIQSLGFSEGGRLRVKNHSFGDLLDDLTDPFGINDKMQDWMDPFVDPFGINDEIAGGFSSIWLADWLESWADAGARETINKTIEPFFNDVLTPGAKVRPWTHTETIIKEAFEGAAKRAIEAGMENFGPYNPSDGSWGIPGVFDPTGPFDLFNRGGVLGSYATGTDYVPRTGPYILHEGEKVTPAKENAKQDVIEVHIHGKNLDSVIDSVIVKKAKSGVSMDKRVFI